MQADPRYFRDDAYQLRAENCSNEIRELFKNQGNIWRNQRRLMADARTWTSIRDERRVSGVQTQMGSAVQVIEYTGKLACNLILSQENKPSLQVANWEPSS
jgi:hypothetical protein